MKKTFPQYGQAAPTSDPDIRNPRKAFAVYQIAVVPVVSASLLVLPLLLLTFGHIRT